MAEHHRLWLVRRHLLLSRIVAATAVVLLFWGVAKGIPTLLGLVSFSLVGLLIWVSLIIERVRDACIRYSNVNERWSVLNYFYEGGSPGDLVAYWLASRWKL